MNRDISSHRIFIIDFGSQYTQLIARRIRELGVYCEIWPYDNCEDQIKSHLPKGIILSGGPESVTRGDTPRAPKFIFNLNVPVLGICYGMQTMADQLGGAVETTDKHEYGSALVKLQNTSKLFSDIEEKGTDIDVWMSHGDRVTELPNYFHIICSSDNAPIAGMADENKKFYGIQFHPEVTQTSFGLQILNTFVINICECKSNWNPKNIIEESIKNIREKIGNSQVILGLSGGVDSSVVAALLNKAVGKQLTCIFIDNGLLRLNEGDHVISTFDENMGLSVKRINAENEFLQALEGVTDPEKKRKVIGGLFIEIFEREAKKLNEVQYLAQGTIYPDVIESAASGSGKSHAIKSHHNVGGLPEVMQLELVEPLRELFKDEVRKIGIELGLPKEMIYRHPFPGPGLGVRILGEVKKIYADKLRLADNIFIEELHKANLYHEVSQAFAVFLPVKSVGVVGDARQYEFVISLRAVKTIDFMTASFSQLPFTFLEKVSQRIINEIKGISRVTYDISSKPPATIEWE
tara:strand:- start:10219 stop:11781 length:1563 start_codon:yes stop_codon:yes gene_type:complete